MSRLWKEHMWWAVPFTAAVVLLFLLGGALTGAQDVRAKYAADQEVLTATQPDEVGGAGSGVVQPGDQTSTPAHRFVTALGATAPKTWGKDFVALTPFPSQEVSHLPACVKLPQDRPAFSGSLSGETGVSFTALTTDTGYGAVTVSEFRNQFRNCGTTTVSYATGAHPVNVEAFTAVTTRRGAATVTHVVWSRSDVVVLLSTTHPTYSPVLKSLVTQTDRTITDLLRPVCTNLNVTTADALRNPNHPNYQQHTVTRQVTTTLPLPVPSPKYLPVTRWERPEREPHPQLAPVAPFDPAALSATGVVNVEDAPRGSAPELVDVTTTPGPEVVPEAGAEPVRPDPIPTTVDYQLPQHDREGPGCGWKFNGQTPPEITPAQLARDQTQATQNAQHALARQRRFSWLAHLAWVSKWEEWKQAQTAYTNYEADLTWWQEQQETWEEAAETYDQSVVEWQTKYDTHLLTVPTTPPTPTPPLPQRPAPTRPVVPQPEPVPVPTPGPPGGGNNPPPVDVPAPPEPTGPPHDTTVPEGTIPGSP